MADSDRTTTETMKLIKPQTSEAVMIADINHNSQIIDSVFSNGRLFKSLIPGNGTVGSAITARTNKATVVESGSAEVYGDSLTIGCEKGITIEMDPQSKKVVVSHTHANIKADSRGNEYTVPVINWDEQGHITSVGASNIYPPDSPGTPGQVWLSVERSADEPNKKGAWATLSTDGIIKATPSTKESSNTSISITHAKADPNRVGITVGSSNLVPIIKYDEYGHIIYASTHAMYPPTAKGAEGQVWTSVGADGEGNGIWTNQFDIYAGRSKLSDEATRLVKSSDKGDDLTPVYFKDGVPVLCTRRIPAFSNSSHISYSESDNEVMSYHLTGYFETPPADTTGDNLITAGWALDKLAKKQDSVQELDAVLKSDSWTPIDADKGAPFQQMVEVSKLEPGATIMVFPAHESQDAWYDHGVYAMAQGDGWVQFSCDSTPGSDVRVQIAWLPKST